MRPIAVFMAFVPGQPPGQKSVNLQKIGIDNQGDRRDEMAE